LEDPKWGLSKGKPRTSDFSIIEFEIRSSIREVRRAKKKGDEQKRQRRALQKKKETPPERRKLRGEKLEILQPQKNKKEKELNKPSRGTHRGAVKKRGNVTQKKGDMKPNVGLGNGIKSISRTREGVITRNVVGGKADQR